MCKYLLVYVCVYIVKFRLARALKMRLMTTTGQKERAESNWMIHCFMIHCFPLGTAGFNSTQLLVTAHTLMHSIVNKQLILEILQMFVL